MAQVGFPFKKDMLQPSHIISDTGMARNDEKVLQG
jgi:hypothetical protein